MKNLRQSNIVNITLTSPVSTFFLNCWREGFNLTQKYGRLGDLE